VLHTNGVPHYWIADPGERTLIVHRREPRGTLVVLTAGPCDVVRAEPFEATELRISVLFGIEDEKD
jgi:Uma2 family endonuclease